MIIRKEGGVIDNPSERIKTTNKASPGVVYHRHESPQWPGCCVGNPLRVGGRVIYRGPGRRAVTASVGREDLSSLPYSLIIITDHLLK